MNNNSGIKSLFNTRHFADGGATTPKTADEWMKYGNDALQKTSDIQRSIYDKWKKSGWTGGSTTGEQEAELLAAQKADWTAAAEGFKKAAELGNANAQSNIGVLYAMGRGVERNDVEAAKWLNLSNNNGYAGAKGNLDVVNKRMTADQVSQAQKLASDWKAPAAQPQTPTAYPTVNTAPAPPTQNPFGPQTAAGAAPVSTSGPPTKYSFLEGDKYANTYDANDRSFIPIFENQINSILSKSNLTADDYYKLGQSYAGAAGSKRANIIRNKLDSAYSNSDVGSQYNSLSEMNLAMSAYQKAAAMGNKDAQAQLDTLGKFGVKALPANDPFGGATTSTAAPAITSTTVTDPFRGATTSTAAPAITSTTVANPFAPQTPAPVTSTTAPAITSSPVAAPTTTNTAATITNPVAPSAPSTITSSVVNPYAGTSTTPVSTTANTAATTSAATTLPTTTVGPKVDQPWTTPSPDAGKLTLPSLTTATKAITPTYDAKAANPIAPSSSTKSLYDMYMAMMQPQTSTNSLRPVSESKMQSIFDKYYNAGSSNSATSGKKSGGEISTKHFVDGGTTSDTPQWLTDYRNNIENYLNTIPDLEIQPAPEGSSSSDVMNDYLSQLQGMTKRHGASGKGNFVPTPTIPGGGGGGGGGGGTYTGGGGGGGPGVYGTGGGPSGLSYGGGGGGSALPDRLPTGPISPVAANRPTTTPPKFTAEVGPMTVLNSDGTKSTVDVSYLNSIKDGSAPWDNADLFNVGKAAAEDWASSHPDFSSSYKFDPNFDWLNGDLSKAIVPIDSGGAKFGADFDKAGDAWNLPSFTMDPQLSSFINSLRDASSSGSTTDLPKVDFGTPGIDSIKIPGFTAEDWRTAGEKTSDALHSIGKGFMDQNIANAITIGSAGWVPTGPAQFVKNLINAGTGIKDLANDTYTIGGADIPGAKGTTGTGIDISKILPTDDNTSSPGFKNIYDMTDEEFNNYINSGDLGYLNMSDEEFDKYIQDLGGYGRGPEVGTTYDWQNMSDEEFANYLNTPDNFSSDDNIDWEDSSNWGTSDSSTNYADIDWEDSSNWGDTGSGSWQYSSDGSMFWDDGGAWWDQNNPYAYASYSDYSPGQNWGYGQQYSASGGSGYSYDYWANVANNFDQGTNYNNSDNWSYSYSNYYYYGYASGGLISGEEHERRKRNVEVKKRKYAEGGGIATQYYAMGGNPLGENKLPGPESRLTPQQAQQMGLTQNTYAAGGTLLRGPGDGMSDSIPAVINGEEPQRAALADGEFVVPADVVSHLGNGSTEAGSRTLYDMMDRVRQARTGSTKQAPEIDPDEFLPA